jgi:GT2 family glycosyltransferase
LQPGAGFRRQRRVALRPALPLGLILTPVSRRPLQLRQESVQIALACPIPVARLGAAPAGKRASIVMVTFNNLLYTRLCLTTLLANTTESCYELIVVDNASADDTVSYLHAVARENPHVTVIANDHNRGFAEASNQGLERATGDVLVLLNNDTMLPPGWLAGLERHLNDPAIGLVGPVTNRICNEAQIAAPYDTYGGLLRFSRARQRSATPILHDLRMLAMFCLALRREVFAQVGPLDEQFEMGTLEDEDYSRRVRAAGYRVVCTEDVFVHHFDKASFGNLATGEYQRLLEVNRRRFERKWGVAWEPYRRRPEAGYEDLVARLRALVEQHLPAAATVLVVSKGDDALLDLHGRPAWHFPQRPDGVYAGYHPANSQEAIEHLEGLQARGGEYLILPETMAWWLEHYQAFAQYLTDQCVELVSQEDTGRIYALRGRAGGA